MFSLATETQNKIPGIFVFSVLVNMSASAEGQPHLPIVSHFFDSKLA